MLTNSVVCLSGCTFTLQLENGYAVNTDGQVNEGFDSDSEANKKSDQNTNEYKIFSE